MFGTYPRFSLIKFKLVKLNIQQEYNYHQTYHISCEYHLSRVLYHFNNFLLTTINNRILPGLPARSSGTARILQTEFHVPPS